MSDSLQGITGIDGDSEEDGITEEERIQKRIQGIDSLEDLRSLLEEEPQLDGVERVIDEDSAPIDDGESDGLVVDVDAGDAIAEQLGDLDGIGSDSELLVQMVSTLSNINTVMLDVQSALDDLIDQSDRQFRGVVEDVGHFTFDEANRQTDLVDDTDITSNVIRVKTDPTNEDFIWIGGDNVSVGNGYKVEPGATELISVDISQTILKAVAEESGDNYSYIARGPN